MASMIYFFLLLLDIVCLAQSTAPPYGQLKVSGTKLLSVSGQQVQLRGMSLFWSQYDVGYAFWNAQTIKALRCKWNVNAVRAPLAVQFGGYAADPATNYNRLITVIQAAIDVGIYVLVDWQSFSAASNATETALALKFFANLSAKYKGVPNVIYEPFNEPQNVDWVTVVKPYHQKVVKVIRANDANALILLGTPNWSTDVDVASMSPLTGYKNLMYTLHFYAASHQQPIRDKAQKALNNGLPIFVSEFGTCEYTGDGTVNAEETRKWWTFLDINKISYLNWAIENKAESCSALAAGTSVAQLVGNSNSILTTSGKLVKDMLLQKNKGLKAC